jgi:hypothetical protein
MQAVRVVVHDWAFWCYARLAVVTPEDTEHPHEDLVDPLCGGLKLEFPAGRTPEPQLGRVPPRWAL